MMVWPRVSANQTERGYTGASLRPSAGRGPFRAGRGPGALDFRPTARVAGPRGPWGQTES